MALAVDAVSVPHLLGVAAHCRLHVVGRVAGSDGMVLVSHRRPKERHDPVAHDLVDGTLVPVNGVHHAFEHRIEDGPRLFGITIRE